MTRDDLAYVEAQLLILIRAARRGRNLALDNLDSSYIDSFQHLEDEAERTLLYMQEHSV